jgi:hypothetical protein
MGGRVASVRWAESPYDAAWDVELRALVERYGGAPGLKYSTGGWRHSVHVRSWFGDPVDRAMAFLYEATDYLGRQGAERIETSLWRNVDRLS